MVAIVQQEYRIVDLFYWTQMQVQLSLFTSRDFVCPHQQLGLDITEAAVKERTVPGRLVLIVLAPNVNKECVMCTRIAAKATRQEGGGASSVSATVHVRGRERERF
uniref:Uncharacterized protein n=1 Tax=Hyaloperonospora arabidopsidis (strain Emoy2) TaxID=559515 RepID=M4B5B7_HYAAE